VFTFLFPIYYNYNGDSMKDSKEVIMTIANREDIKELEKKPNIKYINLDIKNTDLETICYLIENGNKYSYSETIDGKKGYIYVPFEVFKQSELFILEILNKLPLTLDELEIARYLYITIGKNVGYDINVLPDKNETFNLKNISTINNMWGSIYHRKGTNISLTKLYLHLCSLMNINCEIITTGQLGYQKNILTFQNKNITTDITQDIPYIQAGFKTRYFTGYDDNLNLDKKIGYIKEIYNEYRVEQALNNIDYSAEYFLKEILEKTSQVLDIKNINPIELSIIYKEIFEKFCPNYEIKIHNLYMNNLPYKEHFILINYNNQFYCFNYTQNRFVRIDEKEIKISMQEQKIGVYLNEHLSFNDTKKAHALS